MSVGRKESGNLLEKAGKAIVDLAFSLSSRNAISNAACSEGMRLRNVCEYNGKLYKLNLDGTRGDEIKMGGGMPVLNYGQPIKTFTANDTYTAVDGDYLYIAFMLGTGSGSAEVSIDGTIISNYFRQAGSSAFTGAIKLKAGQIVTTNSDFNVSKVYIVREF